MRPEVEHHNVEQRAHDGVEEEAEPPDPGLQVRVLLGLAHERDVFRSAMLCEFDLDFEGDGTWKVDGVFERRISRNTRNTCSS